MSLTRIIGICLTSVALGSLTGCAKQAPPRFPNAALHFSSVEGQSMAWSALQDLEIGQHLEKVKHVYKGTTIEIKWQFLGSSADGDSYEFEITDSGAGPRRRRIEIATMSEPIELLRSGETVVTIEDKVFER